MSKSAPAAYRWLQENGPAPAERIPSQVSVDDRAHDVRKFDVVKGNTANRGKRLLGGRKQCVYYIHGHHSKEQVVSEWRRVNADGIEVASDRALYHNCPKDFREVFKDVLGIEWEGSDTADHGAEANGGACPMCGAEFDRTLGHHLSNGCPDR